METKYSFNEYLLPFRHPGEWALALDSCKFLGTFVKLSKSEHILEFGSGYSSSLVAYELDKLNHGFLHSIDNSKRWSSKALQFVEQKKLSRRVAFHVFELTLRTYKKYAYVFYDIDPHFYDLQPSIDLVIIDGPHHDVGREGAIYEVFDKVKVGGYLFLDDCKAEHMKRTIERWSARFPKSIEMDKFLEIGNGITIIKKLGNLNNEPLTMPGQLFFGWMRAIRNYLRIKKLRLNE
jgi:predicted O-methyltransferase YrrM